MCLLVCMCVCESGESEAGRKREKETVQVCFNLISGFLTVSAHQHGPLIMSLHFLHGGGDGVTGGG